MHATFGTLIWLGNSRVLLSTTRQANQTGGIGMRAAGSDDNEDRLPCRAHALHR